MLGLVVMSPGRERFYEREVAHGPEAYYGEAGEAPGRWAGAGAAAAGLAGPVLDGQLSELFGHGRHPLSGVQLGSAFNDKSRSGFALSLSAPKSVSVLWALGGGRGADAVRDAHDAAVDATIGFLDTHAAFSRQGRGGVLQVDTEGLLAAVYLHRTSRAEQPQLHSHVLAANRVRCGDGKWRALDGRELFAVQTAAGNLYRAALRSELTRRLGVRWNPVDDKGLADVAGVPTDLLGLFSSRSRDLRAEAGPLIDAAEAAKGRALTTRERAACSSGRRSTPAPTSPRPHRPRRSGQRGFVRPTRLGTRRADGSSNHRQLSPVGPGGLFRLLATDTPPIQLETIRRFSHEWEADASRRLRDRDATALADYDKRGRISGGTQEQMMREALAEWAAARAAGETVVMLAGDRATVDELNRRAREMLAASGTVKAGRKFAVGDEIVTLRNDRTIIASNGSWVANGDRWTITAMRPDGQVLAAMAGRPGVRVELPAAYAAEHVALGYATTIYKAQGLTVDHAIAVITPATSAEPLYVALTRGRHTNRVLVALDVAGDEHTPTTVPSEARADAVEALEAILRRDAIQLSATEALRRGTAAEDSLHVLVPLLQHVADYIEQSAGPDNRAALGDAEAAVARRTKALLDAGAAHRQLEAAVAESRRQLDQARQALAGAEQPRRLRGPNKTAVALADTQLAKAKQALADNLADLARSEAAAQAAARSLAQAKAARDERAAAAAARKAWLEAHPDDIAQQANLAHRVQARRHALAADALAHPPAHLLRLLGPLPEGPSATRAAWAEAAEETETYREQHQARPDQLGKERLAGRQARQCAVAADLIDRSRQQARHDEIQAKRLVAERTLEPQRRRVRAPR